MSILWIFDKISKLLEKTHKSLNCLTVLLCGIVSENFASGMVKVSFSVIFYSLMLFKELVNNNVTLLYKSLNVLLLFWTVELYFPRFFKTFVNPSTFYVFFITAKTMCSSSRRKVKFLSTLSFDLVWCGWFGALNQVKCFEMVVPSLHFLNQSKQWKHQNNV